MSAQGNFLALGWGACALPIEDLLWDTLSRNLMTTRQRVIDYGISVVSQSGLNLISNPVLDGNLADFIKKIMILVAGVEFVSTT